MPTVKKSDLDYFLYAVTDFPSYPHLDPVDSVRQTLLGGTGIVQLREKYRDTAEIAALAKRIIPVCRGFNACFIVNDDVEAALISGADGVHVGQHDTSLSEARLRLGPDRIVGVSVQTVGQAVKACRGGADYLGVGAVFPTSTKTDADSVSLETLKRICDVSTVPVVAIGGVNLDNMDRLAGSGIRGVSIVSAIFAAEDIRLASAALYEKSKKLFS